MIGALQKFSLIDYPGRVCAIVFTLGCNFRCPYCHNPELVVPEDYPKGLTESDVLDFLEKRRGKLDAISITGGEPTLHEILPEFIERVKALGYAVKLDTNGSRPERIEALIRRNLVDYIAMDVKAPMAKYASVSGVLVDLDAIFQSIRIIRDSGIDYEFRTTVLKEFVDADDLVEIAHEITNKAVSPIKRFVVQNFVPNKSLNPSFGARMAYSGEELEDMRARLKQILPVVAIR